jgi:signal transduction histidine kinase
MLALIFHHSLSLNLYQRSVLEVFGHFLGSLLQAGQNIKTLFDERTVDGQMAVLGLALGQLRHRLRNELGGIGNALNDARRQGMTGPWAEEIRDTLDNVEAELDSSRYFIKPFEPKLFSVSDVWMRVKTVCAGRAKLKNVSILPFGGPQDLGWYSDPDIVALILENLVQNATEAFSDQTNPQVWLEVEPREDGCGLTVRDNGPGIPIVNQSKLFNLGFTTRSTGTGFALYFSRRRARDLGGDLFFVAQDGPGAAFTLKLPPKTGGNGQ